MLHVGWKVSSKKWSAEWGEKLPTLHPPASPFSTGARRHREAQEARGSQAPVVPAQASGVPPLVLRVETTFDKSTLLSIVNVAICGLWFRGITTVVTIFRKNHKIRRIHIM